MTARRDRIAYLAHRHSLAYMAEWWRLRLQGRAGDDPPEIADLPRIATHGADHAEIPDPPALADVGWRTHRSPVRFGTR